MFTICRMDALGLGAAVAAVIRVPAWHARAVAWRRGLGVAAVALFVVGLVATRGYPRTSYADQTFGYTILAAVFAAVVLGVVLDHERGRGSVGALFANPVLRSFGKYSYAIYMFHQPFNLLIGMPLLVSLHPHGIGLKAGGTYMLIVIAASYLAAVISYYGYEKHFLALKRFFQPGQPGRPGVTNRAGAT
jgi:peptidoglycan/LPS O-acetylase OafA/YrhL